LLDEDFKGANFLVFQQKTKKLALSKSLLRDLDSYFSKGTKPNNRLAIYPTFQL